MSGRGELYWVTTRIWGLKGDLACCRLEGKQVSHRLLMESWDWKGGPSPSATDCMRRLTSDRESASCDGKACSQGP